MTNPIITTHINPAGNTIIHLTDGSTVGALGDQTYQVAQAITGGTAFTVHGADNAIVVNAAHILAATYTKTGGEQA